jgi:Methyltransferase domain
VETGVLYGASSAHLLSALAKNAKGELYSIDLGCQPGEPPHDFFVPRELMPRWTYIRGDVRKELPPLLARLGRIDMFHHDSLHTFEQMTWEYERAFDHLNPGGVLSSHDVCVVHSLRTLFSPNAFPAFCRRRGLQWITFGNSGLSVVPTPGAGAPVPGESEWASTRT